MVNLCKSAFISFFEVNTSVFSALEQHGVAPLPLNGLSLARSVHEKVVRCFRCGNLRKNVARTVTQVTIMGIIMEVSMLFFMVNPC